MRYLKHLNRHKNNSKKTRSNLRRAKLNKSKKSSPVKSSPRCILQNNVLYCEVKSRKSDSLYDLVSEKFTKEMYSLVEEQKQIASKSHSWVFLASIPIRLGLESVAGYQSPLKSEYFDGMLHWVNECPIFIIESETLRFKYIIETGLMLGMPIVNGTKHICNSISNQTYNIANANFPETTKNIIENANQAITYGYAVQEQLCSLASTYFVDVTYCFNYSIETLSHASNDAINLIKEEISECANKLENFDFSSNNPALVFGVAAVASVCFGYMLSKYASDLSHIDFADEVAEQKHDRHDHGIRPKP